MRIKFTLLQCERKFDLDQIITQRAPVNLGLIILRDFAHVGEHYLGFVIAVTY